MPLESAPGSPTLAAAVAQATTPTPAATPAPEVPVAAAPEVHAAAPVADPNVVPLPKAMYEELMGYKATVAKQAAEALVAEAARKESELKAQIEKGEIKQTLELIRKQAEDATAAERSQRAQTEERAKRYALTAEVSKALASHSLVPGGAAQLSTLWANEFVVEAAGDSYAVRTPAFQSVGDYVASKLASSDFAHFVRSTTQGGTGASAAASQAAPTPAPTPAAPFVPPSQLGEAAMLDWKNKQATAPDGRLAQGWNAEGKKVPIGSFGLKRA